MAFIIFSLSLSQKLNNSHHPDTILQIIHLIHLLVTRGRVLSGGEGIAVVVEDSQHLVEKLVMGVPFPSLPPSPFFLSSPSLPPFLIHRLWKIMECDVSYVHQYCVDLLLATQDGLVSLDGAANSVQSCYLWRLLHDGLSSKKWTTLFKTGKNNNF